MKWIDNHLLDALAWQESKHDPKAFNKRTGAAGMYQWMPDNYNAESIGYGVTKGAFDPYDPVVARQRAKEYLLGIQARYPDWSPIDVLRAYNWGVGNVLNYKAGKRKDMPKEALEYPKLVLDHVKRHPWLQFPPLTVDEDGDLVSIFEDTTATDLLLRPGDTWEPSVLPQDPNEIPDVTLLND